MGLLGEGRNLFGGGISLGFMAACTGAEPRSQHFRYQYVAISLTGLRTSFALCILISGRPPEWQLSGIDHLVVETPYAQRELAFNGLPSTLAFGINMTLFSPQPSVVKDVDWLSVGELGEWKRFNKMLFKTGRRVILGKKVGHRGEEALQSALVEGGIEVHNGLDRMHVADWYRRARTVYMPSVLKVCPLY